MEHFGFEAMVMDLTEDRGSTDGLAGTSTR